MVASFDLDTQLSQRIVAEYREMPGLRLTVTQAARLFALDADRCRTMLDALVSEGSLARDANGQYCTVADQEWLRRRPATTRLRESRRVTIEV